MAIRYVTTFNRKIYEATGKALLTSLKEQGQADQLLVYGEQLDDIPCGQLLDITACPELAYVRRTFDHLISTEYGGKATDLKGFNQRWFGWFHKIVAQHDALIRRPFDGYTIFLDSDIRAVRPLPEEELRQFAGPTASVMNGDRQAVETGIIVYGPDSPEVRWLITYYLNLYLSGDFQQLSRWDDSMGMTRCREAYPSLVRDLAEGKQAIEHENSNGHVTSGQILPVTPLGAYFEHDKGIHWRIGIEARPEGAGPVEANDPPEPVTPGSASTVPQPKGLFSKLVGQFRGS